MWLHLGFVWKFEFEYAACVPLLFSFALNFQAETEVPRVSLHPPGGDFTQAEKTRQPGFSVL